MLFGQSRHIHKVSYCQKARIWYSLIPITHAFKGKKTSSKREIRVIQIAIQLYNVKLC